MKGFLIAISIVGALLAFAAGATAQVGAEVALRVAIEKETVKGDLKGAIDQYKKLAQGKDRAVAAKALVRMGQCYEKLGDAEARSAYDRVVREFGDQKDSVDAARARLARLGGGGPAPQPSTKLVWASRKTDWGAVSPDGRYFCYTNWGTGNLVLRDFVTGAERVLTDNGNGKWGQSVYAKRSVISRDGKRVAYDWWGEKTKKDESWVAELTGDPHPRRLYEGDSSPYDWSPDGKWIGVSWGDEHTVQLGLIAAQGGYPRTLKSWPIGSRVFTSAKFSSDGKYIVYTCRLADGSFRSYILSADGKSESPLAPDSSATYNAMWSPDGSRVIWVNAPYNSSVLWSVRVADGKPLGEPVQLKASLGDSDPIGFTRDGTLFYFSVPLQADIYLANLDPTTGKVTSETRRVNQHGVGSSWGRIAWLPDGKSLSFWSRRDGRDALVVHNLATHEERELWEHAAGAVGPGYTGWFPDGSLMSQQHSGRMRIFRRVDIRTGEAQTTWTIPDAPSPAKAGFSRDLMTMFIAQKDEAAPCDGRTCTYVMIARELQTGRDRQICRFTAWSVGNMARSLSPDGRDLAFTARYEDHISVMVAPAAGGSPREIYRAAYPSTIRSALDWTQDGSHVLAFYGAPPQGEIWSIPVKGGPLEKSALHVGPSDDGHLTSAVSPDGTQIAFVGGSRTQEIWLMTGLFPDAKPAAAR